ncbi:substrate-binding domain-containing protein [Martelella limonii]|uniref:substrate-binding domain-containing protein n=1 Tax=Martelella limonii TaxID=1647649 RepID=UPI0015803E45
MTVKDLARDLGMSVSTVSRAFYPDAVIASETRRTVLKRAEEIGYRANPFAKSLVTKKTQIVGMVVSDLANPYYPEVMTNLTGLLQGHGMNTMLVAPGRPEEIDPAVDLLLTYQPDLVIILATNFKSSAREKCEAAGAPCIFFNRLSADGLGFGVTCDNIEGGRKAADFLIDSGHTKLAYVSAFPGASTNVERGKGFCDRAVERGLSPPRIFEAGTFSYTDGYKAWRQVSEGEAPDGVFCANDIVAIGFIEGIQENLGLKVPDDVSVVGYDDIAMAGWPSHRLTTVAQPTREMMETTVELARELAGHHNHSDHEPRIVRIPPGPMVERQTTMRRSKQ